MPRTDRAAGGRSRTRTGAVPLALAAAAYLGPSVALLAPIAGRTLGVRYESGSDGVALTFDDGPDAEGTPAVLDALAQGGATATFFLVGEQVAQRPSMVGRILAGGHRIGVHCNRHRCLLRLTPAQVRRDLEAARGQIEDAGGRAVELYRPPYGVLNAAAMYEARRHGWETLLWTAHGWDWTPAATPVSIAQRVTRDLRRGAAVLLHDSARYSRGGAWRNTVPALPAILAAIREMGLHTESAAVPA